jgi:hypothetical protein
LEALLSRDSKGIIPQFPSDPIMRKVLLRCDGTAWQFGANHEHPGFIQILLLLRNV